MKWNELKEGQKVVLQQELVHFDAEKVAGYSYMTRAQVNALITVVHKVGAELTYDPEGVLYNDDGEIGIRYTDMEIDPALYMPIIE